MSDHNYSSNQTNGIDIRRIIREKPITSLALVAVFSLVVGLGLVIQSDQMLTSSTRAAISTSGPQCPAGTMPLFKLKVPGTIETLTTANITIPGTKITTATNTWKVNTRRGVEVVESGSGTKILKLTFPTQVMFEKVLIYDNDHTPPWTLNGQSLPKTADNTWYPYPYDLVNKGPFTTLEFNSNGDSPHFNVCIPSTPPSLVNSPTTTPFPSISPTRPPVTTTPMPISCAGMTAVMQGSQLYLTITPNNPSSGYYFKVIKDGQYTIVSDTFSNSTSGIAVINAPSVGKYTGYVSRTFAGNFVTSSACTYTYAVATPTKTPTPTVNTASPRCVYAGPDTPVPAGGGTVYVNVLAENAQQMKLTNITTGQLIGIYPYNNMGSTPNEIKTFIRPDNTYTVEVAKANTNIWYSAQACMFGGAPTGLTPTGEPNPGTVNF